MSDNSLNQLINSLKTEAIEAAEKESDKILSEAHSKAEQIVLAAEKKKAEIIKDAEQESASIIAKGEAALRQASRDYSISVRNELLRVFQNVFESEVDKAFDPDLIKSSILKVLDNIDGEVEITLSQDNAKALTEYIEDRMTSSGKTIAIIESNAVLNGFNITKKSEGWSYTITPEAVTEALKDHLNKNWRDIIDGNNNQQFDKPDK